MVDVDRHAGLRINLLDLEVLPAYDDFETAGADLLKCNLKSGLIVSYTLDRGVTPTLRGMGHESTTLPKLSRTTARVC